MRKRNISYYPFFTLTDEDGMLLRQAVDDLCVRQTPQVPSSFMKALFGKAHRQVVPRGTILYEVGKAFTCVYFLVQGDAVGFINEHRDLPVLWIRRAGDFIYPITFSGEQIGQCHAEMESDGIVLSLPIKQLFKLAKKYPEVWHLITLLQEKVNKQNQERLKIGNNNSMQTIDRICWMLEQWNDAISVFSNTVAGSYVGVSADWFSKCKYKALEKFRCNKQCRPE